MDKNAEFIAEVQQRIQEQMGLFEVTYQNISDATGIPISTLSRYITKPNAKIPIGAIKSMAKPLHTTPEYLLGWEEEYVDEYRNELYVKRHVLCDMIGKVKPDDLDLLTNIIGRMIEEND